MSWIQQNGRLVVPVADEGAVIAAQPVASITTAFGACDSGWQGAGTHY